MFFKLWIAFGLALVCLWGMSGAVHGAMSQSVTAETKLEGTWTGPLDITTPDGKKEHSTGVLWLRTQGSPLMGAMGATADSLSAIKNVHATGSGCQFTLILRKTTQIDFDLHLDAGHLKGEGTGGGVKIAVDFQSAPDIHPLYGQIAAQDARLFDAFNARDLETLKPMFAKDLEFYHDKNGITDYDQNIDAFKRHFAGPTKIRRELEDGTLEVYAVRDFGAMEIGVHRFYVTEPGQKERPDATAKFVHIWKLRDGKWQIVRVVSYDHE